MNTELFYYLGLPIYGTLCALIGALAYWWTSQKRTKEERKTYRDGRERYERLITQVSINNKIDTEAFKYVVGVKEQ